MKLRKYVNILSITVIIGSLFFLLWRCKYGYCFNDEPFHITLAERLFNGQVLYADEWHISQNFGVVLLPFYALFRLFSPDNTGIMLVFRYVYCVLWFLTCLYVYITFKDKYKYSMVVFIALILFQPFDLFSLSYNSIGLISALLICCILTKIINFEIKHKNMCSVFLSLLIVIFVLCCPLMAIAYILSIIIYFILYKKSRNNVIINELFRYVMVSIFISVVSFIIYTSIIFLSANFETIKEGFMSMFTTHSQLNVDKTSEIIYEIYKTSPIFISISIITCAVSLLKNKKITSILYFVCVFFYLVTIIIKINQTFFPNFNTEILWISVLGLVSTFIERKKLKAELKIFIYFSLIYLVVHGCLSSDTGIMAISMDLLILIVPSVFVIQTAINNSNECFTKRSFVATITCSLVFFSQVCLSMYIKMNRQFNDEKPTELNEKITIGSAAGIYTTKKTKDRYTTRVAELRTALINNSSKNKDFISLSSDPVIYLDANLPYNTCSAWSFCYSKTEFEKALSYYFSLHNNKLPDVVFAEDEKHILNFIQEEKYKLIYDNNILVFIKN